MKKTWLVLILSVFLSYFAVHLIERIKPNSILLYICPIILLIVFCILSISEQDILKYLKYQNFIQISYVFIDAGVSLALGKSALFGLLHLLNYSIAGILLLISIKIKKNELLDNKYLLFGVFVASLSLAGIPLFNIFVSEFIMFSLSFQINIILTSVLVFASLLCFIAYVKMIFKILKSQKKAKISVLRKIFIVLLSIAVVIMGVIPQIQLNLIEGFI